MTRDIVPKLLPSVARHYLLRHIELSAVSAELPGTPVAPPLGELASGARLRGLAAAKEVSPKVTERARPLTRNHGHGDSIALTKGLHPDEFPLIMYNFFEM